MRIRLYAVALVLTAAAAGVAIASVTAAVPGVSGLVAPRGDRLIASAPASERYVTVETRRAGVSVLTRIPVAE
jgi:hypothetical protein